MIQIASQAYRKTYNFSLFSDAMALKAVLYLLVVLLAFFAVFSVPRFYLNYVDDVDSNPSITYDYHYHLTIETTDTSYIYTTLYTQTNNRPISVSYTLDQHSQIHSFEVNWSKSPHEAVTKVTLVLFMKYSNSFITDGSGMVFGTAQGINIAQATMTGQVSIKTGDNLATAPPTSISLPSFDYDLGNTLISLKKDYSAYLSSEISTLSVNLPTDQLCLRMRINGGSYSFTQSSATILGQVIWSWSQFFPLAFVLWYLFNEIIAFILRENILKRYLVHDPTYRIR